MKYSIIIIIFCRIHKIGKELLHAALPVEIVRPVAGDDRHGDVVNLVIQQLQQK